VLRRLAVFPGSFTLDAVEAVVGTIPQDSALGGSFDVVDLLSRLVDKSMVTVSSEEPEVRYSLLETVREYAGQKLTEAGELEATRTRQRDFCLALADEWAQSCAYHQWAPWIRRLIADGGYTAAMEWSLVQREYDQLLRLAAAHWPYWYWSEMVGWKFWLEEALARCQAPSAARVEALIALSCLLRGKGQEPERWDELLDQAMETARHLDSDALVAQVLFYRSDIVLTRGDRRTAEAMLREALRIWQSTGLRTGIGWSHFLLGWIALAEQQPKQAADHFEMSWRSAEAADDVSMRAHVQPALALVAAIQGDQAAARTLAADGVRIAQQVEGAPRVVLMALSRAGQVAMLGDDPEASFFVVRVLRLLRDTGVGYWADTALELAGLILAERSPQQSAVLLAVSQSLREEHDVVGGELSGLGERLARCRTQLRERLGPAEWEASRLQAGTMTVDETIRCALAWLESEPGLGD